jgi:hypothetical protein
MSDRVSDATGECENQSFVEPSPSCEGVPPLRWAGKTTPLQTRGFSSLKPFVPKTMLNKWTAELHCSPFNVFERSVIV